MLQRNRASVGAVQKKTTQTLVTFSGHGILSNKMESLMPLLLFVAVPIIEMWILIQVGGEIGALPTIGLVVLTAMIGLSLLKRQGLSTLMSARAKMDQGRIPAGELVSGVMLAVGGALLLTPGFVTDVVGFLLLIPATRRWVLQQLIARYRGKIVIDGEYRQIDDR